MHLNTIITTYQNNEKKFLYYTVIMTSPSSQNNIQSTNQRPKLSHIAKLAHTTQSTVSKVINGRSGVSDETRQRIEALLKEMEYSKPPVKHALSTTIMLVLDSMANPWVLDIMQGATDTAVKRSMTVTICAKNASDGSLNDTYRQAIRRARPKVVIFDNAYVPMRDRTLCQELGARYAVIDPSGTPCKDCMDVRIDNWTGGFEIGSYLIGLGHRNFAAITGPASTTCYPARLDGFRAALAQHDIMLDPTQIREGDHWSESARLHALDLLQQKVRPSAIFACSDTQALGVYDAAHQLGLSIPDDLSITGFDDIDSARHLGPPLTTMKQPLAEMTRTTLATLLSEHQSEDAQRTLLFPPTLVVRGSTGPAPKIRE